MIRPGMKLLFLSLRGPSLRDISKQFKVHNVQNKNVTRKTILQTNHSRDISGLVKSQPIKSISFDKGCGNSSGRSFNEVENFYIQNNYSKIDSTVSKNTKLNLYKNDFNKSLFSPIRSFSSKSECLFFKVYQDPLDIKTTVIWPKIFSINEGDRLNVFTKSIEQDESVLNWAMDMGLLEEKDIISFKKHKLENLAGYFHPKFNKDELIISSKLNVILYSCDNELDNQSSKISRDYTLISERSKNIKSIFSGKKQSDFSFPLEKAVVSFLGDIKKTDISSDYFIKSLNRYINATIESLERRLKMVNSHNREGTVLLRDDISAVDTVIELGFLIDKTPLNSDRRNNTVFRKLMILTNRIVSRVNDIVSYSRERKEKNPDNPIISKELEFLEYGIDKETAIKKSIEWATKELNNLLLEFENLVSFSQNSILSDFDKKTFNHASSLLKDCIVGGWLWHKNMVESGNRYTKENSHIGQNWG